MNKELAHKVLAQIKANPDTWQQHTYRCETGMCVAGWAAQIAGGIWATTADHDSAYDFLLAEPLDNPNEVRTIVLDEGSNKEVRAIEAAYRGARVLEISGAQADLLFDADNTLADIERYIAKWTAQ